MLGPPKLRCLDEPILVSLENLVPRDHFYRYLDAKLDLSFVRSWVRDCYAAGGRPSIDPVVFFKLQLIMFFEGLRSERKLMETASLHLAHRWYLGYRLDEPLPDHSSLSRIRTRLGVAVFQRFFEYIVDCCRDAGLVWGKELFFDGTKIRANADIDSLTPRFYQQAKQQTREHVAALFAADSADDATHPDQAPPSDVPGPWSESSNPALTADTIGTAVPENGYGLTSLLVGGPPEAAQPLAAQNQARWQLRAERRLDPNRPPSGPYRRITDFRVSTTDPDAAPMNKGGETKLGYHDHYVVDGGRARIILAALVTPADVQDNQAMLDLLDHVRFRHHRHVRRAVADSKYGTGENLRALEERRVRASVPVPEYDRTSPFFRQQDFTDDREANVYRCPGDTTLTLRATDRSKGVWVYQAPAAVCAVCPLREHCTDGTTGRRLIRPFDEDYRERAREVQTTEAYKKALRKRQVWVEPLFGEAKEWHGLRRFRLRGLDKVNSEALIVAAGQNLKRWLQVISRRRRPAASASLVRPFLLQWVPNLGRS